MSETVRAYCDVILSYLSSIAIAIAAGDAGAGPTNCERAMVVPLTGTGRGAALGETTLLCFQGVSLLCNVRALAVEGSHQQAGHVYRRVFGDGCPFYEVRAGDFRECEIKGIVHRSAILEPRPVIAYTDLAVHVDE